MVRLGRDAVRPAPLPVRARGAVRASSFPADFICEAQDQTRGWFYSLLAVATLLSRAGAVSERRLPRPDPRRGRAEDVEVARATRSSRGRCSTPTARTRSAGTSSPPSSPGTATASRPRRSARACACSSSSCGRPTSSTSSTRTPPRGAAARRARTTADAGERRRRRDLDRWALSRTAGTAELVAERLDAYDATTAGRAIAELVEDLSNWYVRRSRRRFWDGEPAAFATLRACLLTVAKLLAPFCPFIADEIYDNLDGDARERAPVRLPRRPPDDRRRATRSSSRRWRSRARPCASAWARAARPRSRCASRWARRSSSPTGASARRSSGSPRSCARS